jgi:hypothetical protein
LVNRVFRCHGCDIQKEFIQGLTPSSLSCKPDTCGYIYEIPKKKKLSNTKHALFSPDGRNNRSRGKNCTEDSSKGISRAFPPSIPSGYLSCTCRPSKAPEVVRRRSLETAWRSPFAHVLGRRPRSKVSALACRSRWSGWPLGCR